MDLESPLEPLARVMHALDLSGFVAGQVDDETLDAAQAGEAFSVTLELQDALRLSVNFEPAAQACEVSVHLRQGYLRETAVIAALQLNEQLPLRGARFSMQPYSGDLVLRDALPWSEAQPDALALLICDLVMLMDTLQDADADADTDPTEPESAQPDTAGEPGAGSDSVEPALAFHMGLRG